MTTSTSWRRASAGTRFYCRSSSFMLSSAATTDPTERLQPGLQNRLRNCHHRSFHWPQATLPTPHLGWTAHNADNGSTSDVTDAFNTIDDSIPESLYMDPLLGYYEKIWIAGLNGRRARYLATNREASLPRERSDASRFEKDNNMKGIVRNCRQYEDRFLEILYQLVKL